MCSERSLDVHPSFSLANSNEYFDEKMQLNRRH
jgi:hypothetical protein